MWCSKDSVKWLASSCSTSRQITTSAAEASRPSRVGSSRHVRRRAQHGAASGAKKSVLCPRVGTHCRKREIMCTPASLKQTPACAADGSGESPRLRALARLTNASAATRRAAGTSSRSHWFQALLASTLSREEGISQSEIAHLSIGRV